MKLKQVETTAPLLLETCTACCSPGSLGPMTDHLDEILLEYVQALTLASRALFTQVTAPPPQVTQPALLTLPGDYLPKPW